MNFLEERITRDGIVKEGNVLKVDSFLNHQMDIELFDQMGEEWARRFKDKKINKILTIEASGIGIACIVAKHFHVSTWKARCTLQRWNLLLINAKTRLLYLRNSFRRRIMC